jgi:beta-glucanase (GH16 family)
MKITSRVQPVVAGALAGVVVMAGLVAAGPAAAARSAPSAKPSAWNLVWSDEFDGAAGNAPDASKWNYDIGGSGWGNQEREYYTDSRDNSYLDGNGHLVIQARTDDAAGYNCWYGTCQYTSARLLTSGTFSQTYGRFEASIEIPGGQGMWPAFWALGNNIGSVGWPACGEIDTMENIGREPNQVHGSLHGPNGYNTTSTYTLGSPFSSGFHTFAADWYPDHIDFSVDGNIYDTEYASNAGSGWVFNQPFFLLLNLAIGGSWPGDPDGSTPFPAQMIVDYVRVYTSS